MQTCMYGGNYMLERVCLIKTKYCLVSCQRCCYCPKVKKKQSYRAFTSQIPKKLTSFTLQWQQLWWPWSTVESLNNEIGGGSEKICYRKNFVVAIRDSTDGECLTKRNITAKILLAYLAIKSCSRLCINALQTAISVSHASVSNGGSAMKHYSRSIAF